jgi:hypothetical protein
MFTRSYKWVFMVSIIMACHAAAQPAAPKTAARAGKIYSPPKTPWGDPDLQGLWPSSTGIPLERAPGLPAILTDEQVKEREQRVEKQRQADEAFNENRVTDNPRYWQDYAKISRQSSLVIDPPNGRLPALTPEGEKRKKEKALANAGFSGEFDSYLDFDAWNRCITRGMFGSMTRTIYNNGNEIIQAPGYVIIRHEMIHENRVIPLDGRPHVGEKIRLWMGDSRGHWEGNTLVIETTNITTNRTSPVFRATEQMRMVERLTRTAPDQLTYELKVDDPGIWTQPWTISIPLQSDPSYKLEEYACHEANYGLANILKGSRAIQEKAQKAAGQPVSGN